ncbi:MAG: metal ABC transporter substrate-binding protein [Halioglobus sp.]
MPTGTIALAALIFWTTLITGCDMNGATQQQVEDTTPYIVVVNNPLLYFARRLIGDEVDVRLLAPADIDPASWQPTVEDVLQIQGAELLLLNGAAYSPWLDKVSLSSSQLVVTSEAAKDHWIVLNKQVTHSHGPGGEHAHGSYAFTTWMDMSLAQLQAKTVAKALQKEWPEKRQDIEDRFASLSAELESLDREYAGAAAALRNHQLVYSHPVYQYFERRYEIPGISLHWEPDVMPSDEQWQALGDIETDRTLFIWEAQPSLEIIERMGEMGIKFVVVDPAANVDSDGWMAVQRGNIARLAAQ